VTRLDLVVGPNGAGQTTFVALVLRPELPGSVFVNADEIAARRWPDDPAGRSYDAARIAEATRARLLVEQRPFIAETVFSHPSKLDLIDQAQSAGFHVALHVLMVPEDLSVHRVAARVAAGGHDVPEEKIRARWRRLWTLVVDATGRADDASFWDNSRHDGPQLVAQLARRIPSGPPDWPAWSPKELVVRWADS
jgi:predicted ABC-type ATPase